MTFPLIFLKCSTPSLFSSIICRNPQRKLYKRNRENDNVYLFVKPCSNMNFGMHALKAFY